MQSNQVNSTWVVNELELGQSLNYAIASSDSAKFSLLLAMLSDDVTDQPQFSFANTQQREADATDASLRRALQLTPPKPLYADDAIDEKLGLYHQLRKAEASLADLRLADALMPQPLVGKSENDDGISADIKAILPHWKQNPAKPTERTYPADEPMISLLNQLHSKPVAA
ncbi:VC2046/SO_2500 family protein [Corallincola platygyrae]|uniref:VC2046/SO_2500 family protein n=1 Tax=Corallincola platygyrae TaxID=1193278 RepID=A0ABW4XKR9_9GAMM